MAESFDKPFDDPVRLLRAADTILQANLERARDFQWLLCGGTVETAEAIRAFCLDQEAIARCVGLLEVGRTVGLTSRLTPKMLEAGMRVFEGSCIILGSDGQPAEPSDIVRAICAAIVEAGHAEHAEAQAMRLHQSYHG